MEAAGPVVKCSGKSANYRSVHEELAELKSPGIMRERAASVAALEFFYV